MAGAAIVGLTALAVVLTEAKDEAHALRFEVDNLVTSIDNKEISSGALANTLRTKTNAELLALKLQIKDVKSEQDTLTEADRIANDVWGDTAVHWRNAAVDANTLKNGVNTLDAAIERDSLRVGRYGSEIEDLGLDITNHSLLYDPWGNKVGSVDERVRLLASGISGQFKPALDALDVDPAITELDSLQRAFQGLTVAAVAATNAQIIANHVNAASNLDPALLGEIVANAIHFIPW